MKRTTIFLDEPTERRLRDAASRSGRPMASMVREAIVAYLDTAATRPTAVPRIAGRFSSGRSDTSERVDELLWNDPHS